MKNLLFISPAVPNPTGSGLRMRGWLFLKALAREYRITLVAGCPAFPDDSDSDLAGLDGLIEDAVVLRFRATADPTLLAQRLMTFFGQSGDSSWDWAEPSPAMRRRLSRLRGKEFALVHVFRLYMLSVMSSILGNHTGIPIQLDLDDWESKTRNAVAEIAECSRPQLASRLKAESMALAQAERRWFPQMKRIFVCSRQDAAAISGQHGLDNVCPVNNAVSVPASLPPCSRESFPELLFIGALGYFPNQDAVYFFLTEVLPKLRAAVPRPFRLVVAGTAAPHVLRKLLQAEPLVTLIQSPKQVEPLYRRATAAIAPIRAGGGTRIKVLEAFAQGRPLVATAAAVAGLDVESGVHYIQANTADEWVAALRELLEDPAQGAQFAKSAFAWVRDHSLNVAMDRISSILHDGC